MPTNLSLGTFTENATGSMTEWSGGYATLWLGATDPATGDHYDFDGGTVSVEIADKNDTEGLRPLLYGFQSVEAIENAFFIMYVPAGFLRAKLAGSGGNADVQVRIVSRY